MTTVSWQDIVFGDAAPPSTPPAAAAPSTTPIAHADPYVASAFRDEIATLRATPDGGRNTALNTAALKLGRLPIDRAELLAELIDASYANGLVRDEGGLAAVEATIASGFRKADEDGPREIPERLVSAIAAGAGGAQDEDDDGPPKLVAYCLTRNQLRDLPDPEPLIDEVLDKSTVALLYGKWGSGKSFLALDWGACIATGKSWQGRTVEQHRVLYLAAEGAHGMKIRTDAWETGWHHPIPDEQFTVLRRPVNLTNYGEVRELAALIRWGGYGAVFIDTLARCMVGADENSAKDSGQVVDALSRLQEDTPDGRGVIVGVHHTGKDGTKFRGSSVFEGGADTVYRVTAEGRTTKLSREKRKDGPTEDTHTLQLDPVEGTKSCILSLHYGVEKPERAQRLLATFLHHFSTTGATKSELRLVSDLSDGTFYRALSDLLRSGDLVNEGTDKRPFIKAVTR